MAIGNKKVFARVEPSLRGEVKREADLRFQGNESMVVREALILYLDLRRVHGRHFEAVVASVLPEREGVAA